MKLRNVFDKIYKRKKGIYSIIDLVRISMKHCDDL